MADGSGIACKERITSPSLRKSAERYRGATVTRIGGDGEVLPGKAGEGRTFRLPARGFGLFHLSLK